MTYNKHILICDDEPDVREMVGEYLEKRDYRTTLVQDGVGLKEALKEHNDISAILLDIRMPGEDGLSILRTLRSTGDIVVIMLTAIGDVVDRIIGLEMGADDYITKPVNLRELEARLKAVLRRADLPKKTSSLFDEIEPNSVISFDRFRLDIETSVLIDEENLEILLTSMEFRLLSVFLENRSQVLSRDQLLELVHGRDWDPFDRSIDIMVSRLRRKIETIPSKPTIIRTVRGIGYIFG